VDPVGYLLFIIIYKVNIMRNKYILCSFSPGILILLCAVLAVSTVSCNRNETSSKQSRQKSAVTGPIIDTYQGGNAMDKLDLDNQSPESLALLGDRYFESGRYVPAIEVYRKVLELDPNDVDTYNDLGLSLFYTGQPDQAIDNLRKGTQINPNYQNVWLSLGFVLSQTARTDEAKLALQKAVDINPDTPMGQEAARMLQQYLN
jgi:tetratricopeptide (TPR) repeat protein